MQENTNKAIAINSLILYVRLAIVSVCGLLYTRFSLQALGMVDFGLFSVIGGIISFIGIFNTIMISTSNRFMAIAIGRKDLVEANRTFNVNLIIHVAIALFTIIVALPVGHWYIYNYVNYSGDIENVVYIFNVIICASAFSFIGVPYNGLLMAKERFFVFCSTDVLSSLFKLAGTYYLIDHCENKLVIYTLIAAIMTAYPTIVFFAYCRMKFRDITQFRIVRTKKPYIDVAKFSGGVAIGAVVSILKTQGSAIIVNVFFTTVMNSALAIANSINNIITLFANNVQKSIAPQIVKSYSVGDSERYTYLVCLSSKVTYLMMFFIAIPFFLIPETIFGLWLSELPDYTITFTQLIIIDVLIMSINAGIPDLVFATGKIITYQLIVQSLGILSVAIGFVLLRLGYPAYMLFVSYFVISALIVFVRPFILKRQINFDTKRLFTETILPEMATTILFVPVLALKGLVNPYVYVTFAVLYFFIVVYAVGLSKNERAFINNKIKKVC